MACRQDAATAVGARMGRESPGQCPAISTVGELARSELPEQMRRGSSGTYGVSPGVTFADLSPASSLPRTPVSRSASPPQRVPRGCGSQPPRALGAPRLPLSGGVTLADAAPVRPTTSSTPVDVTPSQAAIAANAAHGRAALAGTRFAWTSGAWCPGSVPLWWGDRGYPGARAAAAPGSRGAPPSWHPGRPGAEHPACPRYSDRPGAPPSTPPGRRRSLCSRPSPPSSGRPGPWPPRHRAPRPPLAP